jgi:hypothetical protein
MRHTYIFFPSDRLNSVNGFVNSNPELNIRGSSDSYFSVESENPAASPPPKQQWFACSWSLSDAMLQELLDWMHDPVRGWLENDSLNDVAIYRPDEQPGEIYNMPDGPQNHSFTTALADTARKSWALTLVEPAP